MPQVPRLFQAAATPSSHDEYPEEYLSLLFQQQDGPVLPALPEDENMGDEAFIRFREDPEFFLIVTR